VAAAFVAAAGNRDAFNRDYNAAGDEIVTWRRYWEITAEAFGGPPLTAVTVPTAVLSAAFGPDAEVLVENYQFNNVFDCTRAKDELGFRYTTTLQVGFELVAQRFGSAWRQSGEDERQSPFAQTYERFLAWWQETTNQVPLGQW
jgi:nucleoside-diphosphate-sugar epimerase